MSVDFFFSHQFKSLLLAVGLTTATGMWTACGPLETPEAAPGGDRFGPRLTLREPEGLPSLGAPSIADLPRIGCSDDASCPAGAFCHLGRLSCAQECRPDLPADASGCPEHLACDYTGRCLTTQRDPTRPRLKVAMLGNILPERLGPTLAEVPLELIDAAPAAAEPVHIDVFASAGGEVQCPLGPGHGRRMTGWSDHCSLDWWRQTDGEAPRIQVRVVGGAHRARPQVRLASSSLQPQVTNIDLVEALTDDEESGASRADRRFFRGTATLGDAPGGGWAVRAQLQGDRLVLLEPTRTIFGRQALAFALGASASATISWLDAERDMQPLMPMGRRYQGSSDASWTARNFRLLGGVISGDIHISFGHQRDLVWHVELASSQGDEEEWGEVSEGGAEMPERVHNDLLSTVHAQLSQRHAHFPRYCRPSQAWQSMTFKMMEGVPLSTHQETLAVRLPDLRNHFVFARGQLPCLNLAGLTERQAHRLSRVRDDSPAMMARNCGEYNAGHNVATHAPWFARKITDQGLFVMSCAYIEAAMRAKVGPRYSCEPLGEFEITAHPHRAMQGGAGQTLARGQVKGCGAEWFFDGPGFLNGGWEANQPAYGSLFGPDGVTLPVDVHRAGDLGDNPDFLDFVDEHVRLSSHSLGNNYWPPSQAHLGAAAPGHSHEPIRDALAGDLSLVDTCRRDLASGLCDGRRRHCIDVDTMLAAIHKWGRPGPAEAVDAAARGEAQRIVRHWLQVHLHVQRGIGVQARAEQLIGREEARRDGAYDVGVAMAETVESVEAAMALMTQDAWETLLARTRPTGDDAEGIVGALVGQSASMLSSHIEQVRALVQRAQEGGLATPRSPLGGADRAAAVANLQLRTVRMVLRHIAWLDHLAASAPQRERHAFVSYRHLRGMLAQQLAELMRPLAEEPPQVPLFFVDVVGTNSQYFASSDHLLGIARQAAQQADALYRGGVREGLVRALNQGFVEVQAGLAEGHRVADLKRHYGGEIGELCGWQDLSGADIIDRLASGELTLEHCYLREGHGGDAAQGEAESAFRGQLGEAALALDAAAKSLDIARRLHDDTETRSTLKTEQCKALTLSLAQDHQDLQACAALIENAEDTRSDLRVAQQTTGLFGKVLSYGMNVAAGNWGEAMKDLVGTVDQSLGDSIEGIDDLMRRANERLSFSQQLRETGRRTQACWDEVALAEVGGQTELEQIRRVMLDLKGAKVAFDNRKRHAERLLSDCLSAMSQAATLPPPMLRTLNQWFDIDTELFGRRLRWARETTQQAAAALNFETQQTLVVSGDAVAARSPAELERVLAQLAVAGMTREVHGQRPARYSRHVSVRDEALALADEGKLVAGGRSSGERLRARLALPAAAVYDGQGNYLGQGVRLVLSPNTDQQCGEKLWRVDVRLKVGVEPAGAPVANVLLLKSRVFSSQWCRPEEHRDRPLQTAAAAHFRPAAGNDVGLAERRFSTANPAAQLQPRVDVPDRAFYQADWGVGGSDVFAGQGLFGEYTVVFPPSNSFPLDAIDDLELRFDYLYAGRTHLRAAN